MAREVTRLRPPEEMNMDELRTLMDGVEAIRSETEVEDRGRKIMMAKNLIRKLTPEIRALRVKEETVRMNGLVFQLASDIGRRANERIKLWNEVDSRGKWALERDQSVKDRDYVIQQLKEQLQKREEQIQDLSRVPQTTP